MEILITLAIITAIGVFMVKEGDLSLTGTMAAIVGGVGLFTALIFLPLSRMSTESHIAQFKAISSTIQGARSRGESIENAAIQIKVSGANEWLASAKYWNGTVFDVWIVDEVESLDEIQ